jgi:hypothetical protein
MDKVLRDMIRETVSASINTMINQYMRKRALKGRPEDDEDAINNVMDPIGLAARQILDDLLRKQITEVVREEVIKPKHNETNSLQTNQRTIMSDYIMEASFINYFTNVLLK